MILPLLLYEPSEKDPLSWILPNGVPTIQEEM
jgi:hypothetical protein